MLLKYFRTNQPAILLTLPLVSLVFWAPHFFASHEAYIHRGFIFSSFPQLLLLHPLVFKISAFICVTLQAVMINSLLNNSEVYSRITYVPSLIYIILASMTSYGGGMEPFIICNFFILMALQSVLRVYHQNSAIGITFTMGFWIGMAAVFEPACLILVVPAIASVLILRSADWRELVFILIGTGLPFLMLWVIFFVLNLKIYFPEEYFAYQPQKIPYQQSPLFVSFLILAGFMLLQSMYIYFVSLRGIILRIRKMRLVLFYFSISIALMYAGLFFASFSPQQNQILLIPGTLLFSFRMIQPTRVILTDLQFYLFIGIWGFFVYNLYFLQS